MLATDWKCAKLITRKTETVFYKKQIKISKSTWSRSRPVLLSLGTTFTSEVVAGYMGYGWRTETLLKLKNTVKSNAKELMLNLPCSLEAWSWSATVLQSVCPTMYRVVKERADIAHAFKSKMFTLGTFRLYNNLLKTQQLM